tara:strand:+ start:285 stop:479 length:195 start_codon:yes stop_codon:yes gene_type:complete
MNFYAYKGKQPLGAEALGTDDRLIIRDLKTKKGAITRCKQIWGSNFSLYSFDNVYNNATFKLLY